MNVGRNYFIISIFLALSIIFAIATVCDKFLYLNVNQNRNSILCATEATIISTGVNETGNYLIVEFNNETQSLVWFKYTGFVNDVAYTYQIGGKVKVYYNICFYDPNLDLCQKYSHTLDGIYTPILNNFDTDPKTMYTLIFFSGLSFLTFLLIFSYQSLRKEEQIV